MNHIVKSPDLENPIEINLRNRVVAAVWAWLLPGAGHIYQRRTAKGMLFMTCILSTFFFGFGLGGWRVVYASFGKFGSQELRLPYFCQVGVGLPALPALVEWQRAYNSEKPLPPLFGTAAPIESTGVALAGSIYRPPGDSQTPIHEGTGDDQLHDWHSKLKGRYELGTLFTMIAGLLNILAIFDAYGGPAFMDPEAQKVREKNRKKEDSS